VKNIQGKNEEAYAIKLGFWLVEFIKEKRKKEEKER